MARIALLAFLLACAGGAQGAGDRFFVYNNTTATDFTGIWLAPAGSGQWGPNQVLNDPDKVLDHGERLRLRGVTPGRYDARLAAGKGNACIKRGIDLTRDHSFEVRDADLDACR